MEMNTAGMGPGAPKKSSGALIGTIIIVLIIILGGWYLWNKRENSNLYGENNAPAGTQNVSDDITSIDQDAASVDIDGSTNAELNNLDASIANTQ